MLRPRLICRVIFGLWMKIEKSERGRNSIRGSQSKGKGRQPFNRAEIEFKCHKLGHFHYECPLGR